MAFVYPTIDDVVAINARTVELSGGGTVGALDLGRLEGVLGHIQNDDYYPSMAEKLTHLFFCLCKFHCFQDGNKRTAIAVGTHMLLNNGYLYCATTFIRDMENISVQVADDTISKPLLGEIISAHINQETDNETLKLKIYEALFARVAAADNNLQQEV